MNLEVHVRIGIRIGVGIGGVLERGVQRGKLVAFLSELSISNICHGIGLYQESTSQKGQLRVIRGGEEGSERGAGP